MKQAAELTWVEVCEILAKHVGIEQRWPSGWTQANTMLETARKPDGSFDIVRVVVTRVGPIPGAEAPNSGEARSSPTDTPENLRKCG